MDWDIIFPKPQTFGSGKIKVACVGDSITYGYGVLSERDTQSYPALLSSLLGNEYTVENFGVCNRTARKIYPYGYNYSGLLGKSLRYKPQIVVIMLGTNDSKVDMWDKDKFIKGYETIIKKHLKKGTRIIVAIPPPAFENVCRIRTELVEGVIRQELYRIAACYNLETADTQSALQGKAQAFTDGVHPNAEGNKIIANSIYQTIKE